jgi:hypothetical protein
MIKSGKSFRPGQRTEDNTTYTQRMLDIYGHKHLLCFCIT